MPLFALIAVTMCAFAANSVLNRAGIFVYQMDALAFAGVRLASGAAVLAVLVRLRGGRLTPDWGWADRSALVGAGWLMLYLVPFSLAYVSLPAGFGALVLFGVVQLTMFAGATFVGKRPGVRDWAGMGISMAGLVWLLWPDDKSGLQIVATGFMALSGVAWGMFSLKGRGSTDPLADMARSFVLLLPVAGVLAALGSGWSLRGVALAVVCGAITSGVGYAMWYRVLPLISATTGAVAQLSVPVIAIFAGAIFLAEPITGDVIAAAVIVLGGICLSVLRR